MSMNENCDNAQEAKVLALLWASEVADQKGSRNVEWSMDVVAVVKEVLSNKIAEEWNTRHAILKILSKFNSYSWKLGGTLEVLIL